MTTLVSNLPTKTTPNVTIHLPAQTEEVQNSDYVDGDDFEGYQNEDNQDGETTNQDDSQGFDKKTPFNDPNRNSNNQKTPDRFSPARIPFVPSNLWRDLFTKPGILVGKSYSSLTLSLVFYQRYFFLQVSSVVL